MIKPNRLIAKLIITSFLVYASWGLIMPIFALFVTGEIEGGSMELVGLAVGMYWIVKSALQPFLAYRMDKVKGEHDDMKYLFWGAVIITIIPLIYIFTSAMWQVFVLEIVRGAGMAMIVPTISGVFTRHVDKDWESYMWSLQNTSLGFAYGFAAIFGGLMAVILGFKILFLMVSVFGALSIAVIHFTIKNDSWLKDSEEEAIEKEVKRQEEVK